MRRRLARLWACTTGSIPLWSRIHKAGSSVMRYNCHVQSRLCTSLTISTMAIAMGR